MFDFHEKRKIRGLLYSKFSIVVILAVSIGIAVSAYERFSVERKMLERRSEVQVELEALKDRAAALEAKVEHFKNQRGVEEELRSRFDVVKEGEQVVIILDEEDEQGSDLEALSQPPSEEVQEVQSSFWSFLGF